MPNTYRDNLLSIETVLAVPGYVRLRLEVAPADARAIRQIPDQVITVRVSYNHGNTIIYEGTVEIEDEVAGIVVGNFNVV